MREKKFTPNDNGSVIRMLSAKYARCNRGRNRILLVAVALSIVTLTIIFGISYGRIRAEYIRSARKAGTAASGMIAGADSAQFAKVRTLGYISRAGRSVTVGEAEERAETPEGGDMSSEAGELSSGNRSSEEPETVCVVRWMDGDAWEEMAVPAYTDIQGAYPEQEQEIMLSLRSLKALGIDRPEQGMQIDLKVFIGLFRTETETFRLSGWFTDYSEDTEEVSPGYISRAKLEDWRFNVDAEADILFRQSDGMDWREAEERMYADVPMKDSAQKITVSDTYAYEAVNEMMGGYGMAAFGSLVILSGMFFLIHNVMQISMAGDVRQMGLLHVIGTTEKQIRRIYYGQLFRALIPGVISGAALSAGLLLFLLPRILGEQYLSRYGGAEGLQIFRPGILAVSVLFAALLLFIASAGVIHKAARESCAETMHYTGLEHKRRKKGKNREKKAPVRRYRRRSAGMEILFMAWQNLARYRGRFVLTVLSLFLGAEAFLGAVVITDGSDYVHVIEQRPDFLIAGQFGNPGQESGYGREYQSRDAGEDPMLTEGDNIFLLYDNDYDGFSPISGEVREQLLGLDGVEREQSYIMEGAYMNAVMSRIGIRPLVTDPNFVVSGGEPEKGSIGYDYSENTEWIESPEPNVIQILSDEKIRELKDYVEAEDLPVDMDSLENGTGVLILHDHVLSREQEKMAEDSVGEPVYFTSLVSREEALERNRMIREEGGYEDVFEGKSSDTFLLSGYLDNQGEGFPKIRQTWHGAECNLYFLISEKGFEKLPTEKKTLYMELSVEKEKEPVIKSQINEIVSRENRRRAGMTGTGFDEDTGEAGIFCISRSDLMAEAAAQIRGSRLILGSISVVLLIAGFTNYFNVMITGILSRRRELEIMESIGMTRKQKRRMFLAEGGCYCLLTAALILTAGSGILCLIRGYMEERLSYFQYQYPLIWTFFLLAGLAGICMLLPCRICRGGGEKD